MKLLGVFALVFLAGCAAGPSLQELEKQAFVSGDWTKVEKRERAQLRRQSRAGPRCPNGSVGYCEIRLGKETCSCLRREYMNSIMSRQ